MVARDQAEADGDPEGVMSRSRDNGFSDGLKRTQYWLDVTKVTGVEAPRALPSDVPIDPEMREDYLIGFSSGRRKALTEREGVMKRGEPQLCRDYYGEAYVIVDDDGEPVTNYYTELHVARTVRESDPDWADYRIAEVGFKALVPDDGSPVKIVDDPRADQ